MKTGLSRRMLLPWQSLRLLRVWIMVCCVVGQGACHAWPAMAEETPREQALKVNEAQEMLLAELRNDPTQRTFLEGPLELPPVAGKVVDENNRPIAGAVVILRDASGWLRGEFRGTYPRVPDIALCMTGEDGFFQFDDVPTHNDELGLCVIAFAPGRAMASWHVPKRDRPPQNALTLTKECSVASRVVDSNGQPLQGAMVELVHVMTPEQLAQIEEKKSWDNLDDTAFTSCDRCRLQPTVVTAEDGTFHMPHLPLDAGVILRVTHPDTCITPLRIRTGELITSIGERTAELEVADQPNTWRLPRGRQLTVRVTCDDPQVSLSGAVIQCTDNGYSEWFPTPTHSVRDGTVVLRHLAGPKLRLVVNPPVEADYLAAMVPLEFLEGQYALERTVKLAPAKVVTGRVVDSQTGKGIPKVPLHCDVRRHRAPPVNPRAQVDYERDSVETDQEGRFRFQVRPDAETISVLGEVVGYRTIQELNDNVEDLRVDVSGPATAEIVIKLDRAPRIRGVVQDHGGNPVAKGIVKGVVPLERVIFSSFIRATNEDGSYEVDSVYVSIRAPSETDKSILEFWNGDRTEAKVMMFPVWSEDVGLEDQIVNVRLSPLTSATGRVIDTVAGEAARGAIVKLCRRGARIDDDYMAEETTTDADGRFALSQVIPGAEHAVLIRYKKGRKRLQFMAQEGQGHDFGDVGIELR